MCLYPTGPTIRTWSCGLCAEKEIGRDPFAVLLADELLINENENATKKLIEKFESGGLTQLSVIPVEDTQVSQYGIVKPGADQNSVKGVIEKPVTRSAPSNLASIGRYVLKAEIFDILKDLRPGKGREFQLSDAINQQAQIEPVEYLEYRGARFDCGTINGFLDAFEFVSKSI